MNTHYYSKSEHSPIDQPAFEMRTIRLLQIKKELGIMLARPNNPKVWWENLHKTPSSKSGSVLTEPDARKSEQFGRDRHRRAKPQDPECGRIVILSESKGEEAQ